MGYGNSRDSKAGSWNFALLLLVFAIVAVLCGAAAYLKGSS